MTTWGRWASISADRPYAALSEAAAFHALKPGEGALIQGAILGYIGDQTGDEDAYRQAMTALQDASAVDFPDVLRLRAMTAARLGSWGDAFTCLEEAVKGHGVNARRSAAAAGIDWGFVHAFAVEVVGETGSGARHTVDELYATGTLLDDMVPQLRELQTEWGISAFYCDPSEPANIEIAPTSGGSERRPPRTM